MKIMFDCRYVRTDRHDGISRYSLELVTALAKLHPVTMLIHDAHQLEVLPSLPFEQISSPTSVREPFVARQVRRFHPDVVVSPMQTMGSIGRSYGLVLTIHDLIYYVNRTPPRQFAWPLRLLWRLYHLSYAPQRLLLRGADQVATISRTTRELMRRNRLTRRPIPIVTNAPDERFRRAVPGQPPERRSLVYMGSFMPYKNVETIARALHELDGWVLHLCSRADEATLERLRALAPDGSIVAHQGVSDTEYLSLLAETTALVTVSRNEGFGLPVIEGMAAGVPVICSDIPVFREIGADAAVFVDPDSPSALARAAHELEDDAVWEARARAGIARAADFTWEASAQSLLEACRSVHEVRSRP
ncbi:glycosyltransferase family 4 protein [Pseudoclavibacter chungangensis]|uniref:Glycosyltransferase family 4 protein n=2 Tax=Pseudoclavibacter chungangensis TaxID=587635 RepID=A0A7J5BTR9_9MICO|nr:glycosyltransferase family 1 protein [Pseudoclavibacter chungangensis]KAB1657745.1 glycosyltransferase family 4 protein [Pseudoclavibacter chungangensis]NYJ66675.1 glycosyltransferase involved in cell wall biosynthesis [Pseudoclavibacter chungangensis]